MSRPRRFRRSGARRATSLCALALLVAGAVGMSWTSVGEAGGQDGGPGAPRPVQPEDPDEGDGDDPGAQDDPSGTSSEDALAGAGGSEEGTGVASLLSIASVSPWVEPEGNFQVRFEPSEDVPEDAQLTVTIHQALDPDEEDLRDAVEGIIDDDSPGRVLQTPRTRPLSELGDPATGSVLSIPVRATSGDSERVLLPNPGVHPVELVLTEPDGPELWSEVVFLNRLPRVVEGSDPRPPLRVTLLLPFGSGPAIDAESTGAFTVEERTALSAVTALLENAGDAPLALAPRPNTLDGLTLSEETWAGDLLSVLTGRTTSGGDGDDGTTDGSDDGSDGDGSTGDGTDGSGGRSGDSGNDGSGGSGPAGGGPAGGRAAEPDPDGAVARGPLVALPYTNVDTGGLVASGRSEELLHQIRLGRSTVERVTGRTPEHGTWVFDDTVTPAALATLARAGVESIVVPATSLQLDDEVTEAEVASRPVRLEGDSGIRALAYDGPVSGLLAGPASDPGARAHQVVTMLMATWFDTGDATATVGSGPAAAVLVTPGTDAEVLSAMAPSLSGDGPLLAGPDVDPLPPVDPDLDEPVVELAPRASPDQRGIVEAAEDTRRLTDAYASMVGEGDPSLWAWQRVVDQTVAATIDNGRRLQMHLAVREGVDGRVAAIEPPRPRSVVVTSRETTVPLRFRNDLPFDVTLRLRARSPRLEIGDGESRRVVLHPGENRIDLPVTVQAPGESLLRVELSSPVPGIDLHGPDIPVRSTAISGVGAALSIVSVLFLIGWWIHTNRRSRRAGAKLNGGHPSGPGEAGSLRSGG